MTVRTSASRFIPVLLALLALGGCAPLEGDEELLLDDNPAYATTQKSSSASNFRLVIGDLPTRPVKKVDTFRFANTAASTGRSAERTVELVLEAASVDEVEALFADEHAATLASFDEDGSPVMDMRLVGVRLIGRPRVVSSGAGLISAKLAYDTLALGTP
jgi:hypothetical protein